jgi:asparagine synthase (glutamine-hydrolysing)
MCGITGTLGTRGEPEHILRRIVTRMSDAIVHRGPDGSGEWVDACHGIALGHRRLAIVDLSEHGRQPMTSTCGRYTVVYNGEIYNHLELRAGLDGFAWRGHSDTETLLACFTRHGVIEALPKLVGMFALAVWDRDDHALILARDRMGEKPLYVGKLPGGDFVFGSELKALRAHPRWHAEVDRDALTLLLRHNAVPAPHSIYRGVTKLMPGHWMRVEAGSGRTTSGCYWDLKRVAFEGRRPQAAPAPAADDAATDALEALLSDAVRGQMLSDVPLGAFLSGGVDSSTVVALMCKLQGASKVRSFAIGFDEAGFDEAVHAKAVARHLGTDHTELYVTARDALDVIPRLPSLYDEPFADSSQIPTFLVCQMARKHVTVALSGDAGDELFAGYTRYRIAHDLWRKLSRLPVASRRAMARGVLAVPPSAWQAVMAAPMALMPQWRRLPNAADKLHKFAATVLPARDPAAMYRALVSHWSEPAQVVLGASEPATLLQDTEIPAKLSDDVERMSLIDQLTYLPDDILVKVDRAAMGVSLETRVPMLDHRVVEFAWQLPMHQKIRDGQSKWLLRQVLYRHVPRELIERPKQGFGVPLDQWLRGPLREWADDLLSPSRLRSEGFFDAAAVQRKWAEHTSGRRNWQYQLWDILMFQAWWREQQRGASTNALESAAAPVAAAA